MAEQKLVNLTIEGRPVTVPAGTSILEAAKQAGILIPHYCYHPSLPVAGNCRMCQVEVEKAPKLAPACATAAADGQVVHVYTEKALKARQSVLEFLLINHPLDCPVCDASGECELQDYTYMEGPPQSRLREPKRFNPAEDFGGDVLYVTNRCILCTRCVRFMDDVAHEAALNVSERGDRAVIGKAEGHDLTHPWAANVIELCPVGALVSKDFLHKARAWELDRAASICPGCTQGCNMIAETREDELVRFRPRPNAEVNSYFMCDYGRQTYKAFNRPDRLEQPLVRVGERLAVADWDVALRTASTLLDGRRAFVLASPHLSNETLHLLGRLAAKTGGTGAFRVERGAAAPLPGVEDLALREERAPNVTGAQLMGFTKSDAPLDGLGADDVLVVADADLTHIAPAALAAARSVIVIGSTLPLSLAHAAVVLPITTFAEEEGTFTNLRGRVQRYTQAKAAPGLARPGFFVLSDLLALMGEKTGYYLASEAFAALAAERPEFAGLSYDLLGMRGAVAPGSGRLAEAAR